MNAPPPANFVDPGLHDDVAPDDESIADGLDAAVEAAERDDPSADFDAQPARAGCGANDGELGAWIERIATHDERALAALYDATWPRVYGLVMRIVRQSAFADEVVEDTYFQVWRQALRFDAQRGRAMTWLLGMARSRAIDALRREARFRADRHGGDGLPEFEAELPSADALLDAAQGHAALHRALLDLQAQPRQLVALAFFRGLSHEEIASQTELPLGTVKSQIRRALSTLREVLGDPARRVMVT